MLTLLGPAVAALIDGGLESFLWVLGLYAAIIVVDGLILQPVIMRRTAKVPIWASLIVPIVLSLLIGFWGLLTCCSVAGDHFCVSSSGEADGWKESWRPSSDAAGPRYYRGYVDLARWGW